MKRVRLNKEAAVRSGKYMTWMLAALIALAVAVLLLVLLFVNETNQIKTDGPIYQYYQNQKREYDTGTKLKQGKYNVLFMQDGDRSDGDQSPIYLQEKTAIILPQTMGWNDPTTGIEWKIPALSILTMDESGIWCHIGKKSILLTGGFLADEQGTYLFLDDVQLEWNGKKTELSPFSFYSAASGMIRVYHYETQELLTADQLVENAVASSRYTVDLTAAIYTSPDGTRRLLAASPAILTDIRKK